MTDEACFCNIKGGRSMKVSSKHWLLFAAGILSAWHAAFPQEKRASERQMRLPITAPELIVYQHEGEAVVTGVYFNDAVDSGPSSTAPHNVVLFRCPAGTGRCEEADAEVYERGGEGFLEKFLDGFLNVSYYIYEVRHLDAHSLIAVAPSVGRKLFVNFDSYEARVEFHQMKPGYEWRIVSGDYALTHDPRLSHLCREVYSRPNCAQK